MCFGCVRVSNVCVCMCAMYSFNLQNVRPCCTYNRQIQIPVKVSARYKLPHLRSGGSSGTHTQTLGRLEATRVTQFSMVDSIELRTEVGQGQEAAHVAQLVAAGRGRVRGSGERLVGLSTQSNSLPPALIIHNFIWNCMRFVMVFA